MSKNMYRHPHLDTLFFEGNRKPRIRSISMNLKMVDEILGEKHSEKDLGAGWVALYNRKEKYFNYKAKNTKKPIYGDFFVCGKYLERLFSVKSENIGEIESLLLDRNGQEIESSLL